MSEDFLLWGKIILVAIPTLAFWLAYKDRGEATPDRLKFFTNLTILTVPIFWVLSLLRYFHFYDGYLAMLYQGIAAAPSIIYLLDKYLFMYTPQGMQHEKQLWLIEHQDEINSIPDVSQDHNGLADLVENLTIPMVLLDDIERAYLAWLEANPLPLRDEIERPLKNLSGEDRNELLTKTLTRHANRQQMHFQYADTISRLARLLPANGLFTVDPSDTTWGDYIKENIQLPIQLADLIRQIPIRIGPPAKLRTEHQLVVAGSGHGKTQLFQSMILDDIQTNATIIVIDSQSQIINNLVHVVPVNRLVHITPTDTAYPLSINLFDKTMDPTLFEYVLSALDAGMTSTQSTVYRFVSRLVSIIPGGNIDTMRQILEKDGIIPFQSYLAELPPIAQAFFKNEFNTNKQYIETKQQILRRLYTVLENDIFANMFMSTENKLDMELEIEQGKVILIDTAKGTLSGTTFKIFGRFFIAQIAKSVFSRSKPYRNPVYLYIDEAADYFSDEDLLVDLFAQARKYNVGIIIAFQFLGQLPAKVSQAIMANTSIKLAGGVSSADRRSLANEMDCEPEFITMQPKGTFAAFYKNMALTTHKVELGRLEKRGRRSRDELDRIRQIMRERYGRTLTKPKPLPKPPAIEEEASEW